jgi:hypothetical protein
MKFYLSVVVVEKATLQSSNRLDMPTYGQATDGNCGWVALL